MFTGCSSDNEDADLQNAINEAYAPDEPRSEFRFYKENADNWSFRVTPTSDPTCPLLTTSSTTTRVDNPCFYYTKTSDNTAEVTCYYTTVAWNNYGSWQQYELILTFLSPNHGKFEGVYKNSPTATGVAYKGVFVYDTDLEPEDFFTEDDEETDVDWDCLTGCVWKSTDMSYLFNDDKTFTSTLSSGQSYNGIYNIDYANNILNITYSWETAPTAFRVIRLNENVLTMVNNEYEDEYAVTYTAGDSPSGGEDEINISKPEIVEITEVSATIKGTVLGNVNFSDRGIVYGYSPNPTVNDNKVSINSNVINKTLNLEKGAKYYVRLFGSIGSKIYYGPEVSFTMAGEQVKRFQAKQTYWSDFELKISIDVPVQVQSYGLCYSLNPSPKITDNYLEERRSDSGLNHTDEWRLTDLERGKTYHVRPYHIEGSRVLYSDEFTVTTLGVDKDLKVDFTYDDYNPGSGQWFGTISGFKMSVEWSGLEKDTYKLETNWPRFSPESVYIEEANGYKKYEQAKVDVYGYASSIIETSYTGSASISDLEGNIIVRSFFKIELGRRYYSGGEYRGEDYVRFVAPVPSNLNK